MALRPSSCRNLVRPAPCAKPLRIGGRHTARLWRSHGWRHLQPPVAIPSVPRFRAKDEKIESIVLPTARKASGMILARQSVSASSKRVNASLTVVETPLASGRSLAGSSYSGDCGSAPPASIVCGRIRFILRIVAIES